MSKIRSASAAAALCAFLFANSAAGATGLSRVWVSGHGTDASGCGSPTAPCRSLQYAHDHIVAAGGEIDILDPAGYGAINVTKSITIVNDGVGTAGVQTTSGIAININASAGDSIYLRGLNIDGVGFTGATGVQFNTGSSLIMVGCVVRHFGNYGIALAPTGNATQFEIVDTISANNHGGGILLRPPSGSFATNASLTRLEVAENGADGLSVDGGGTSGSLYALVSYSTFSNNVGDGIKSQSPGLGVSVLIGHSGFIGNLNGVEVTGGATVAVSDIIAFGNTVFDLNNGVPAAPLGGLFVYGNNAAFNSGGSALKHAPLQ